MAIFDRIENTNSVAVGITVVCVAILLVFDLKVKAMIAKKCRFPIPIQFILVNFMASHKYNADIAF